MSATIVIKMGGVASDNLTAEFFQQVRAWQKLEKKVVIIHGGGHYISDLMGKLNIPVETVNGLRVTTEESLKATMMALIGQVQPSITMLLSANGFQPIGMNAGDGELLIADFVNQDALGFVGEITEVKVDLIEKQLAAGFLPVLAPLGVTKQGQWLNVNADTAACKIAAELKAEALYLLTDVPGVKKNGEWLAEIKTNEIQQLADEKVITGGMLPKLASAALALKSGVAKVHITNAIHHAGTIIKESE